MRIYWSVSESRIRSFSKTGFYVYKCTFHILVKNLVSAIVISSFTVSYS